MLQRLLKLNFPGAEMHIKEQMLNTVSKLVKLPHKSVLIFTFLRRCCGEEEGGCECDLGRELNDICDGTRDKAET